MKCLLAGLVLMLAACAASDPPAVRGAVVPLNADKWEFHPNDIASAPGEKKP